MIVDISKKTTKLCPNGLKFNKSLKLIENYWKSKLSLVYLSCAKIDYDYLKKYKIKVIQYIIYINTHKIKNHKYKILGYTIKIGKIYTYLIPKYKNYGAKHQTIIFKYLAKSNVQAKISRKVQKILS